jgi:hypothetical protein
VTETILDGLTSEEETQILIELLQCVLDQNWNDGMPVIADIREVLQAWNAKYNPEG